MRQERKKTKRRNKGKGRRTMKNAHRESDSCTRSVLRGGKPKFIKTIAYYTDESKPMLVDYKIIHGNMDKDEQKKYADKHKVYYPVETPSIFDEIFGSVDPRKIRLMTERFFTPPLMFFEGNKVQAYRNNKLVPCEIRRNLGNDIYDVLYENGDFELVHKDMIRPLGKQRTAIKEDGETIVIHDGEDIEKIQITNKMLMNHYVSNKIMENLNTIPAAKLVKGGASLNEEEITRYTASVEKYNDFINKNKDTLLNGLLDEEKEVAENLLRTPVFFNIISEAQGFGEIPDMNHAKIIMENNKLSGDELLKKINEHSSVPSVVLGPKSEPLSKPVAINSETSGPAPDSVSGSGASDPKAPQKLLKDESVNEINNYLLDYNMYVENSGIIMDSKTSETIIPDSEKIKQVNNLLNKHGYIVNNNNEIEKRGLARRTLSAIGTGAKNIGTGIRNGTRKIIDSAKIKIRNIKDKTKKNKVGIYPPDSSNSSGSDSSGSDSSGSNLSSLSGSDSSGSNLSSSSSLSGSDSSSLSDSDSSILSDSDSSSSNSSSLSDSDSSISSSLVSDSSGSSIPSNRKNFYSMFSKRK